MRVAVLAAFLLTSCSSQPASPTESPPATSGVLISEVMTGVPGDNNHEFIELFNHGPELIDLEGWSIWYRLPTGDDDLLIYRFLSTALIPPWGHILLARQGEAIGATPDAVFAQSLNTSGGAIQLRASDGQVIDSLGWGNAPSKLTEAKPAPAPEDGYSLERAPGGPEGASQDTGDNAADFKLASSPNPQNAGSAPAQDGQRSLVLQLAAPETVAPGETFEMLIEIANHGDQAIQGVTLIFPIPAGLTIESTPEGASVEDSVMSWRGTQLEPGEAAKLTISLAAPWSYFTTVAQNYFVRGDDPEALAFGAPVWIETAGGAVPIDVARELIGSQVTVEGVASMYTGGFYAGSGNVKFYLQDDTGGVQVWVPGGAGQLAVEIGDKVRVSGLMDLYRGTRELVPATPDQVEILGPGSPPGATPVTIERALQDSRTLPGRLIEISGAAARIEEFSYSYEVDIADADGQLITLYLDKDTGMTAEPLDLGASYRVLGILEVPDARVLLYPRTQNDLIEAYPPVFRLEAEAPSAVQPSEIFMVTLTAYNHTPQAAHGAEVWVPLPIAGAELVEVLDDGVQAEDELRWALPELPANGGSASVRFSLRPIATEGLLEVKGFELRPAGDAGPAIGSPLRVFLGDSVPIWAVQGDGSGSPYKLEMLTTRGIVTGLFPGLGGFWIQNPSPDDDPLTSEGLFVEVEATPDSLAIGDLVTVAGRVREVSGQTQLELRSIDILSSGSRTPQPVALDPPQDEGASAIYFESLEGMLVEAPESAFVVGPSSSYGEYVLVPPEYAGQRVLRGDETGMLIMVDDGDSIVHDYRDTLGTAVSVGDLVSGVRGPLAYTYGAYKIEPLEAPRVNAAPVALPSLEALNPGEFSLMTWNVENLFDILDPHPTDPPRPRKAEYDLALDKVAATIQAAGYPTLIGLQEVENLGILEDLAAHPLLAGYAYQPILLEGTDSRGIDVGYLVRGDQAQILSVEQRNAPEGLTSRPPLLVHVKIEVDGGLLDLYVINNHFLSLAGGEAATEPRRTAQAAWNVTILEEILAEDPEAHLAVLGDLNSFYDSAPLDTLRAAGLRHVFERLPPEERYSYVFEGVSETLDHILVTPSLMELLGQVHVLHVNAEYALPSADDDSPLHKSDHDPVIAVFAIP